MDEIEFAIQEVIKRVAERVKQHLRENIQKYIYDFGAQYRTHYVPTGEFYGSIETTLDSTEGDIVSWIIESDPSLMSVDGRHYVHGNPGGADRRASLMQHLNEGTGQDWPLANKAHPSWQAGRQAFFDITLQELDNGLIDKFFAEECASIGLEVA